MLPQPPAPESMYIIMTMIRYDDDWCNDYDGRNYDNSWRRLEWRNDDNCDDDEDVCDIDR